MWDLHLDASRLTAWLRYRVVQGAVKTLEVDLPADLVVRSADIQRTPSRGVPAPAWMGGVRLRAWHVATAGGKRTLHLDFPYPVAGEFEVTLELAPHTPLPGLVTLSLPMPRGERMTGLHYLAYRAHQGLDAQRDTSQNITRIKESAFALDWPGVVRLESPSSDVAYKISPDRAPILRLHLRRSPPVQRADLEVTVQAGADVAEVQATPG